ncbi:MAG: Gfo/Idh/MocA family oxidoreductase [Treponema sp.]|jgi:predicted dehydrogenase|nr:Gfo/Idh/MocA family oxidoreductase [Treponema sp.]
MSNKHGFGIIGLGAIAGVHARAIEQMENAAVTAVFDTVPGRAAAFAEKNGVRSAVRPYDDLEAFLRDTDTEFVTITTPSGLHLDSAVAAARAGKHVIVEKPLEITTERCEKIIAAAAESGVLLSGIFQSRFFDAAQKIREAIDRGRFGKVILCDAYIKWYRSQEYYDSGAWRGTKQIDGGGALMNQSIHALDLLLWFGGNVKEVSSRCATRAHERIEVEDVLVSTLVFENGAMGTVEASTAVWPGAPKRIEILGTAGSAVMEEENIVQWKFADEQPEDESVRNQYSNNAATGASDPMGISPLGHQRQFEDCIKAVETGTSPLIDGRSAARAVALVEAMYQSAASRSPVYL